MRVLVSRTDRIGDLVLSTPVFEAIKRSLPGTYILVMARKGTIDVISDNPSVDEYIAFDPDGEHRGMAGALKLARVLQRKRIDVAVELFMSFYPALAVKLARIRRTIGPGSRTYSGLLLTDVVRQRRKESRYNEAAYNLMLLRPLGIEEMDIRPRLYLSDNKDSCERLLLNQGIKPFNYFVVHPGMGGSAKNLSAEQYTVLIRKLSDRYRLPIIITGSYVDNAVTNKIMRELAGNPDVRDMCCVLSLQQLKAVLFFSKAVIAPSTGPMHVAAAFGRPTVAIFSPIRAQSRTRWAPYLNNNTVVIEPKMGCKEQYSCNKNCLHYDCMNSIVMDDVLSKLEEVIAV